MLYLLWTLLVMSMLFTVLFLSLSLYYGSGPIPDHANEIDWQSLAYMGIANQLFWLGAMSMLTCGGWIAIYLWI